jgi:hypothetical protein
MNDQRVKLLHSLLDLEKPTSQIVPSLNACGWDSDRELLTLTRHEIAMVLRRYLNNQLSAKEVEEWANAIEGREDVGYESDFERLLDEAIYQLANPVLTLPLSHQVAKEWLKQLS